MKKPLLLALAFAMSGCQSPSSPQATGGKAAVTTRKATTESPAPTTPKESPSSPGMQPVTGATRVIDPAKLGADALANVSLVGKVKLVSDKGAGILSNNSGSLISNNGGGLVSDKGAGLISNNGGGVVGAGGGAYRLLAEGAPAPEALLAEARIDVLDGEGKQLVGPDGAPIGGVTDSQGNYQLTAQLPKENFVLRVRLFPSQNTGSELLALLPNKPGERTVDIDTASSLGASYVLDRYVLKRQDVYNKLPATEAEALTRDMAAARAKLTKIPGYKPAEQTALVEELRTQTPALSDTLERIKALLLAGQKELGNGLPAVKVSLSAPVAVMGDEAGNLLIGESFFGRIRRVGIDGTIGIYPKPDVRSFGVVHGTVRAPDGTIYLAGFRLHQVFKIAPDGNVTLVAGTGSPAKGPVDVPAAQAGLSGPSALALGPDGTLYIGEAPSEHSGRILKIGTDGVLHEVTALPPSGGNANIYGLAVGPDGTLYALDTGADAVKRLKPGGSWELVAPGLDADARARIAVGPDGLLYLSESVNNRVWRFKADGSRELVAGTGMAGYSGDGGPATSAQLSNPSGLYFAPSGTLFLADSGNAVIRSIGKDGIIRTVAGAQGATQVGDALAIALNAPAGLTVDAQGRLVVAESGASLIKRLDGSTLSVVAGTTRGFSPDGTPAAQAKFHTCMAAAYAGQAMYVLDAGNLVLRRIGPDGSTTTVAGMQGRSGPLEAISGPVPASGLVMRVATALTVDPEGRPVWSDVDNNWVMRLNGNGTVEVVAGSLDMAAGFSGDGGPASGAKLSRPTGLAYDAAGNLYIADTGNMVVRKVAPDGTISTIAGTGGQAGLMKVMTGAVDADGASAVGATIVGPSYMCLDATGNLYVAEMGTTNLAALGLTDALPAGMTLPVTYPKIRKITPDGKISTVAGPGTKLLADTTGDNRIGTPAGLAIDGEGRLIISDGGFNQLKVVPKGAF